MPRTLSAGQRAELYIHDLVSGSSRLRHTSHDLLFEAPNWTPDGRELVINGDGRLFRLGVESGDPVEIPLGDLDPINNDHVISPDGRTGYVSSDDGHLYAVPLDGQGGIRRVSTDKGDRFRHYLHGISRTAARWPTSGWNCCPATGCAPTSTCSTWPPARNGS